MVGVNKFQTKEEHKTHTQMINEKSVLKQLDRLNKFKENRNMDNVKQSLSILREIASIEDNLLPHIIDAVKAHATLGEISDTFREVFGEY